ncbi:hypothetical protein L1987_36818 [Smallanthus sonchifolius]|uniref:Uncharacterized protein n=1 Tax=Smallanthus sonchifolius TaxID=185202 RepID=A0ACB9HEG3_9ASTR|nr:hypothetical protein L1987_36818 [Smallanthus sonchifolius]
MLQVFRHGLLHLLLEPAFQSFVSWPSYISCKPGSCETHVLCVHLLVLLSIEVAKWVVWLGQNMKSTA